MATIRTLMLDLPAGRNAIWEVQQINVPYQDVWDAIRNVVHDTALKVDQGHEIDDDLLTVCFHNRPAARFEIIGEHD